VKRRYDRPDTKRLQNGFGSLAPRAAHRLLEPAVKLHLLAVVTNQVDRLRNFGDRFETILSNFKADQGSEFVLMRGHEVGSLAQKSNSVAPVQIIPDRHSLLCGRNGAPDLFPAGHLKFAEDEPRFGRRDIREMSA